jgi:hypothetical protein
MFTGTSQTCGNCRAENDRVEKRRGVHVMRQLNAESPGSGGASPYLNVTYLPPEF